MPATDLPAVKACLFDMDGLLIDSEDKYTICTNEVLAFYGRPELPWHIKAQMQGRPGPAAGKIFQEWAQLPATREEYMEKVKASQRKHFPDCKPLPGATKLLHTLAKKTDPCVHLALATSSHADNFKIKTDHLKDTFDVFDEEHRVLGDDPRIGAGRGKPAPDIYLLALKTINDRLRREGKEKITPAECLVFEDSVPGVESGRRAGMQVVWCPHPGLLNEYRGREEAVLAGQTGEYKEAEEKNEQIGVVSGDGAERKAGPPGEVGDGWSLFLPTLEDFPYEKYAIRVQGDSQLVSVPAAAASGSVVRQAAWVPIRQRPSSLGGGAARILRKKHPRSSQPRRARPSPALSSTPPGRQFILPPPTPPTPASCALINDYDTCNRKKPPSPAQRHLARRCNPPYPPLCHCSKRNDHAFGIVSFKKYDLSALPPAPGTDPSQRNATEHEIVLRLAAMDGESQAQREFRLRSLWAKLDPKNNGSLDYAALKIGLNRMNHPLKDADGLIKDMLAACDINHDGRISYDEFCRFCTQTEKELWQLFQSIDRDHSGRLDKGELSAAFERAGVAVSNARLERFFSYIDKDHDGTIDFSEWRDFLLFIPTNAPGLKAVFSYYQSTAKLTAEGDVHMSDEALQGLGTILEFLKTSMFGAITQLVKPAQSHAGGSNTSPISMWEGSENRPQLFGGAYGDEEDVEDDPYIPLKPARRKETATADQAAQEESVQDHAGQQRHVKLTDFVPHAGYFLAGGLSGITSRTATAPLDRLKVYLIAQTDTAGDAVVAAKKGKPVAALRQGVKTLWLACRDLWAAGGIRSLFAGNGLNVLKVMPESSVKFGAYEASKRAIAKIEGHDDPKRIASVSMFAAGGTAGMIAQAAVYPLDTLKFQMQCETVAGGAHGNKLIFDTAKKMWARHGIVSFYRGLPMGLVGMFPYAAIDLSVFETLKKQMIARKRKADPSIKHDEDALPGNFYLALMGGFSGAIGASVVYPINLLRTRLQSQGTVGHPRTYTGIVDVTRQTVRGEGVRGLFKGLTPNLLKVVPAVSITYVVYENTKKALHLQ